MRVKPKVVYQIMSRRHQLGAGLFPELGDNWQELVFFSMADARACIKTLPVGDCDYIIAIRGKRKTEYCTSF